MRQKGFTLIELLGAMAVSAMVMMGIVLILAQVMTGSDRNRNQVVALTDVNQAALAIKKDLQMAQSTDLADGEPAPQGSVELTWIDYSGFETETQYNHCSSYTLSGSELRRTYDGVDRVIGRHITYIGFTQNGRMINVVITATGPEPSQRNETLQFSIRMRTEEVQ